MKISRIPILIACALLSFSSFAQNNIAEEVAWMIGDTPIYKSEIEEAYQELQSERTVIDGDPYCVIPEQIAIERLYLHQADIDTVEVQPSTVSSRVESQINYLISNLGSKEKVEQYFRKSIPELREYYTTTMTNRFRMSTVQESLTDKVKATPSEVNKYFRALPQDSIPYVPLKVETKIITLNPVIPQQEIDNVKARLRDYTDRVNRGESEFGTLAILYSEAPEGVYGGEIGFMGRAQLVPEYAAVAFNLNDPKKVSKIVETEYGFHIIQLIEKRGDRVNTRHILLRPKVSEEDLKDALNRLDSIRTNVILNPEAKLSFEETAKYVSQDKDTRNSNGVMVNPETGDTRFEMSQLPQEVAKAVANLQPGEISEAFIMKDPKSQREMVAIVKLEKRIDAHQANYADDYQLIKDMYENAQRQKILDEWLEKKIKDTYVRVEEGWRGCTFKHDGWIR